MIKLKICTQLKKSKKKDIKNMAASVGSTLLTGRTIVYYSMGYGLNYSIESNQLIIKACVINHKMNNTKQTIYSTFNNSQAGTWFYNDLKQELFKKLEKIAVKLMSKEVEKINDGSGKTLAKRLLIIFLCTIVFIALLAMI